MPLAIEDYALIGDCKTAALVGRDGSVDWLCLPRFDSGACFAALLGTSHNGRWLIAPIAAAATRRRYRPDTPILETRYETPNGTVMVTDLMSVDSPVPALIRIVTGLAGCVAMRTELVLRFDYGRSVPWVSRSLSGGIDAVAGPERIALRTTVPLRGHSKTTVGEFSVAAGERISFVLTHGPSWQTSTPEIDPYAALDRTANWWLDWVSRCRYAGPYSDAVRRSLVTLKALTYAPTGGIVAAPTASLPERAGGTRNWDYRYCWLRDATFTLQALLHLGYQDEARAWCDWLLRAVAGSPDEIQVLYGVAGERRLPEWEVPWLPGYRGASPVRVGNAAALQIQLDVYGEVEDALYQARRTGLAVQPRMAGFRSALLRQLACAWKHPDRGIWEIRGEPRHFVHSKTMAWVAFDRAAMDAGDPDTSRSARRWRFIADSIRTEVCVRGFDTRAGTFVQSYGSDRLDASLLLMPIVGFLPPEDPRIRATLTAIERRLLVDGRFVRRYDTRHSGDGLPAGEGAFLACSFWLVDAYVLQRRFDDAQRLYERLLAHRNDVGLLAEEIDPANGAMLGNFPQAYSHVGIINSAINLATDRGPARQRAETGYQGRTAGTVPPDRR